MPQKYVITTPEGHHIAIEVPLGVSFGDPGTYPALSKAIAAGLLAAHDRFPPQPEV